MNAAQKILDLLDRTPVIDNGSNDGDQIVSDDEDHREIGILDLCLGELSWRITIQTDSLHLSDQT